MKPKCKSHVHYAATEDGVYFRTWTNEFVIKGPTIYQWIEQVLPYLTGERTLDELVAPLPTAQANFVRTLVHELVRRGVVVDASMDSEVPITEQEQALYRQTILYLEDQAANGRKRFRAYREARVLLSGEGQSYRALVRSMIKMGLQAPVIVENDDAEMTRWLDEWKERDGALDVTRVASGRADTWLCGQTELPALVVHVSDEYKERDVGTLLDASAERGIPALIGTQLHGYGVVGPLIDGAAATGWGCLLDRFVPPSERAEEADSPVFHTMIGNVVALEAFKALTELDSSSVRDQVALINPCDLEMKHHKLWPSPLHRSRAWTEEAGRERFLQIQESTPLREFLGVLETIKDERLGFLTLLHPGDLWQIPFAHAQAVVRLPGLANGRQLSVIAGGEQIDEAMEMAVREALTAYARCVEELRSGEASSQEAVWSHGRDVHEWQGRGTLLALAVRANRDGGRLSELDGASLTSGLEGTYLKMLTLRYGMQVRLFAVDLGVLAAHQVRVWSDGQWIGSGLGRTRREALKTALLQALSGRQMQEHHPEMTAATFEAVQLPIDTERDEWGLEEETPSWQAWNSAVQERLRKQGLSVVLKPWLVDEAPLQAGVLVGQIGLEEVSDR